MKWFNTSLKNRIYLSMLALVVISLLGIGITTYYFFNNQNSEYHLKRIQRKEKTVNLSLQYFLNDLKPEEVNDFITKEFDYKINEISNVNSLTIIIYNLKGEVLINTNENSFNSSNSKNQIDPYLLFKLKKEEETGILNTSINGEINSYSYAKNKYGENMLIINIPYNPNDYSTKSEMGEFLIQLMEVFLLLFIGAGIIAYLLSKYITKSIAEVRKKIESVQITQKNEKLIWTKKDEIGVLVNAYNEMINKLDLSKEELAKNQRQIAWREMAKQVAHEIKNPLTPMKLSVQHLKRAINIKSKEEKLKLEEFEAKMIQQINLLSEIANEFSNYAELPKAKMIELDLIEVVKKTINLFKHNERVNLKLNYIEKENYELTGDINQLTRVFTNLINNSIQAIDKNGHIEITVKSKKTDLEIHIIDDGNGIPKELKQQIFEPQFTTKSNGKGLGLAMVAQILQNHNGDITLIDSQGKGAYFKLTLPKSQK